MEKIKEIIYSKIFDLIIKIIFTISMIVINFLFFDVYTFIKYRQPRIDEIQNEKISILYKKDSIQQKKNAFILKKIFKIEDCIDKNNKYERDIDFYTYYLE